MQFIYKLFVTNEELIKNLPISLPKRDRKTVEKFVKHMRKQLFFRKIKNYLNWNNYEI